VANFRVDIVYYRLAEWLLQVTIKEVLKLPPRLSERILVSLLSR
jgi:hypothetical protein